MIIGAQASDFSSIIDKSPPSFGVFYWNPDAWPNERNSATVTKEGKNFLYEFSSTDEVENEIIEFEEKSKLLERMISDNLRFNSGQKCTIEF